MRANSGILRTMEELPEPKRELEYRRLFDIALGIKGVDGVIEVLGGLFLAMVRPAMITGWVARFTAEELAREPNGLTAHAVHALAHSLAASGHWLIAGYLVLHGLIKVLLVVGIFSGRRIAYPLFMASLLVFGVYEIYRGMARHEVVLQVLAALDFAILILTVHEYRIRYGESITKIFS